MSINIRKAVCFGAAGGGARLYREICRRYEVVAFCDNDSRKWGGECCGVKVYSPKECLSQFGYDSLIITSAPGLLSIKKQCLELGVGENRIVTSYIEGPLESRILFLSSFAEIYRERTAGSCAEAGVFEGDFAREINACFPDRTLHLFDTFTGFDIKDIQKEGKLSAAAASDYGNTSVELVLSKMPFPEKCEVHKGYFPETAIGTPVEEERFCFVNLDMDLYEPTYQGIRFFSRRMEKDGVILIHDYFADNFKGPREAVTRFMDESKMTLSLLPIGDGISVAICGF